MHQSWLKVGQDDECLLFYIIKMDGVIQIPDKELEAMGLHEGDEVCLLYLTKQKEERHNDSGEFILERRVKYICWLL